MKFEAPADLMLMDALVHFCPTSSKNRLRSWIKEGRVSVDETIVKNTRLQIFKGQLLSIGQRKKMLRCGIEILYDDSDIVVIHKPSGLLSVAAAFEKGETAHAWLKGYYPSKRIYTVHRLDQDTSGVMVFALSEKACEALKEQFENHAIERAYTAVVEGKLVEPHGTWRSYQYEDRQYVVHETEDVTYGRLAVTHYRTLASNARSSLLELKLETGRKNQIRVHCQSAGHPILGDKKYGARSNPIRRLCLHAHLLAFRHPVRKKMMKFEVAPPEVFSHLVQKLQPKATIKPKCID